MLLPWRQTFLMNIVHGLVLSWALITSQVIFPFFTPKDEMSVSKKNFTFQLIWPYSCLNESFLMSFGPNRLQLFWIMSHVASLHNRALTCIGQHCQLCTVCRHWFLEVVLSPYSDFHYRVMPVFTEWSIHYWISKIIPWAKRFIQILRNIWWYHAL